MAFGDIIQSVSNQSYGTSVTVTLGSTAVSGNLLVVCHFDRASGQSAPTGFTRAVLVTDSGNADDISMYYKVSAGTEGSVVCNGGGYDSQTACVLEIEGSFAGTPLDDTGSAAVQTDTSAECGTATGTTSDAIGVAGISVRHSQADEISAWSNSFTEQEEYSANGNTCGMATKLLSATGDVTTIGTIPDQTHMGLIAIFKAAAAGTAGVEIFRRRIEGY